MTFMSFKSRLPFDVPSEQKEVLLAGYVWRGSFNLLPVTAAVADDFTIIANYFLLRTSNIPIWQFVYFPKFQWKLVQNESFTGKELFFVLFCIVLFLCLFVSSHLGTRLTKLFGNGLLKTYALSMEDKMVSKAFRYARNYGWEGHFNVRTFSLSLTRRRIKKFSKRNMRIFFIKYSRKRVEKFPRSAEHSKFLIVSHEGAQASANLGLLFFLFLSLVCLFVWLFFIF